jgi:hypothetical protein
VWTRVATDHCLFTGTETALRSWLNELSGIGWITVSAYQLTSEQTRPV